jgi:hypothetical protein
MPWHLLDMLGSLHFHTTLLKAESSAHATPLGRNNPGFVHPTRCKLAALAPPQSAIPQPTPPRCADVVSPLFHLLYCREWVDDD